MNKEIRCPECNSENAYQDVDSWTCPECFHEWNPEDLLNEDEGSADEEEKVLDSNGNILNDGDSVVVIKDLKVKGFPQPIKSGTKVKNIRLTASNDGHNISCKIDGFGGMDLKSEFVKKA